MSRCDPGDAERAGGGHTAPWEMNFCQVCSPFPGALWATKSFNGDTQIPPICVSLQSLGSPREARGLGEELRVEPEDLTQGSLGEKLRDKKRRNLRSRYNTGVTNPGSSLLTSLPKPENHHPLVPVQWDFGMHLRCQLPRVKCNLALQVGLCRLSPGLLHSEGGQSSQGSSEKTNPALAGACEQKGIIWLKRRVIVVEIQNHFTEPISCCPCCSCKSAAAIYF